MRGEPENTNLKVEANSNDINVFSEVREVGGGGGCICVYLTNLNYRSVY